MTKPRMEAQANDLDRGTDDCSASSGSNGELPTISGCDGSAARAVSLQLQGCGGCVECTNQSIGSKTKSVCNYTASSSTSTCQPKGNRAVLSGWRDAGRKGF